MQAENSYHLKGILRQALRFKKHLLKANLIAVLATICAVPVPLLLPLMVDEVLLNHPGSTVAIINAVFRLFAYGLLTALLCWLSAHLVLPNRRWR